MAIVPFTRFPWWNWGGKEKDAVSNANGNNSLMNSLTSSTDSVKFGTVMKMPSSSRRINKKWRSREERRIDKEYDVVIVPSDDFSLSDSESDDSDWSIGWLEPHAPGFQSEHVDEKDDSFAVFVPCYKNENITNTLDEETNIQLSLQNFPAIYSAEGNNFVEQWLSSLQNL